MAPIFAFVTSPAFLTAAGTGIAAVGQIQAGEVAAMEAKNRQIMADYQARLLEKETKEERARSIFEQQRQAEAAEREIGAMVVGITGAGGIPGVGTNLLAEAKQASELELENLMIGYTGIQRVTRLRTQAEINRMQAGIYGERAGYARRAGYMRAGTTLLKGFA